MKKYIFFFSILILSSHFINAQAIRKDFLEMTDSEKDQLVLAFYHLRDLDNDGIEAPADPDPDDDDIINDLGDFHDDFFSLDDIGDGTGLDIHFNLLDEPERDIFLAWHRAQMFEIEQHMQDFNPNIGLPYWNTLQDVGYDNSALIATINNTLYHNDFLGPFNADWGLSRNTGGNATALPTPTDSTSVFNQTNHLLYSNGLERGKLHTGGHIWVGGVMGSKSSPKDPTFYLHHTFVDKLWDDWETINQSTSFLRTDMIRYDGTYTFHGVTQPLINPNSITDAKVYGTFYAEDQLAELEGYTVNNTFNPIETFYYQYTIQSGNNFTVPNTKECKFESVNKIVLTPGFTAETGSTFTAKIDTDNDISTSARFQNVASRRGVRNHFNYKSPIIDAYSNTDEISDSNNIIIKTFPNPFKDKIYLKLSSELKNCKVELIDIMGKVIRTEFYVNLRNIEFGGMYDLSNGVYVLRVSDTSKEKPLIVRKFIKH